MAGLGFYLFVVHMLTARSPVHHAAPFQGPQFRRRADGDVRGRHGAARLLGVAGAVAADLGNYPVETAGLVLAPRGIGTMVAMMIAGRLANRVDPRLIMLLGVPAAWRLALPAGRLDPGRIGMGDDGDHHHPGPWHRLRVRAAADGVVWTMKPELRTQGTSLLSLVRNIGSAIGISLTSALLDHQTQAEHADLAQFITPFARPLQAGGAVSHLLDPATSSGAALLNSTINTQAQVIAYMDDYKFLLMTVLPAAACLLLMRRPGRATPAPQAPAAAMD